MSCLAAAVADRVVVAEPQLRHLRLPTAVVVVAVVPYLLEDQESCLVVHPKWEWEAWQLVPLQARKQRVQERHQKPLQLHRLPEAVHWHDCALVPAAVVGIVAIGIAATAAVGVAG